MDARSSCIAPSLVASLRLRLRLHAAGRSTSRCRNSTLLPTYGFVGLENYVSLWANRRWNIAYTNLFFFSGFYVVGSMAVGLLLAILIDQRIRGESFWRTIFLYPLAVSFIVTGTVWSGSTTRPTGIQFLVDALGWTDFSSP